MKLFISILTTLLLLIQTLAVSPVSAQETGSPASQSVVDRQFASLDEAQTEYLKLFEQYRLEEQEYSVARAQFMQLNTLASQEVALRATRNVLRTRAEILYLYTMMLEMQLNQTTGIPVENKSPELVSLNLLKEKILRHRTNVNNSPDRFFLDQESNSFIPTIQEIQQHSYFTQNLLKIGRSQTALDKIRFARTEIISTLQTPALSSFQRSQLDRASQEIDRSINEIDQGISKVKSDIFPKSGRGTLSDVTQASKNLSAPYAQMNQALEFLRELLQ